MLKQVKVLMYWHNVIIQKKSFFWKHIFLLVSTTFFVARKNFEMPSGVIIRKVFLFV